MPPRRRTTAKPVPAVPRVVLYLRVSTAEQADSGLGLAAQETALRHEAERRGWTIAAVLTDAGVSGSSMKGRVQLAEALRMLAAGEADALAVSKLDRLSRSLPDSANLMATAEQQGWAVVALDLGVDTTTPGGELMAGIMASLAQWERRIIGQRTRDALAEKRAAGVRLGRPQLLPLDVVARIVEEKRAGASLRTIAAGLERDAVPTAQGGARWYASTIAGVLASQAADDLTRSA